MSKKRKTARKNQKRGAKYNGPAFHTLAINTREKRGMRTQYEIVGVRQARIAEIETCNANPTLSSLVKLANGLGCTVAELLTED